MNILAVGPHPDDIEFGCSPLLIQEAQAGNRVKMLVLSRGEAGTRGSPDQREREARAAARLIGADIEFLDFGGDCRIEYNPENRLAIAAQIRAFRPSIVLAPGGGGNQHPDHVAVSRLTRDACRIARYGGVRGLDAPAHKIDNLFYYNITQHLGRAPDLVFDIGDVADRWVAAMQCHESQISAKSYIDLQKTAARLLGLSIGVDYALGLFLNDPLRLNRVSDVRLSSRNF